jgi:hypothetical protein
MTFERITALRTFRRLCTSLILALGIAHAGSALYIPKVDGQSLNGDVVHIPADVHGSGAILIVGFTRKSGEQSKQWGLELSKMKCADGQRVEWYGLPVLSDVPRLIRPLVLQGMRSGLTLEVRSRFVPIYSSSEAWKQTVQYSAPDDADVALISKTGQVEHLWHGVYNADKAAQVKQSLCSAVNR